MSFSLWPDTMGRGGVHINRELICERNVNCTSFKIEISLTKWRRIVNATPSESYYHDGGETISELSDDLWHNCTTYSTKMWNMVAPKQYQISDGVLGVDVPGTVAEKISKWSGAVHKAYVPKSYIDWDEVYYVNSNGTLIPADLIAISKGSVNLIQGKSDTLTAKFVVSHRDANLIKWVINRCEYRTEACKEEIEVRIVRGGEVRCVHAT